jgi:REP element-mobilizing transposase RayT
VVVLRRWEAFCGVRVLTYCVMSNHFHVLVEVPPRPVELPSDEELIARVAAASGAVAAGTLRQRLERVTLQGSAHARDPQRRACV